MSAINSFVRAVRGGLQARPARAYIIPLDIHKGDEIIMSDKRELQYFPQTISDQKATNYQTKVIPGLSHPLYQWTSGGPRTISFQAVFSRDRTYTDDEKSSIRSPGPTSSLGVQAQRAAGRASFQWGQSGIKDESRNVDIPSAIAYLRSFLDPEYSTNGQDTSSTVPDRPHPPRKMILGLPGMRINWGVPSLPADEMYSIMTQCDVNYDGFFPDGSPRMARVDLSFAEIIQIQGTVKVHDALNRRRYGNAGYNLGKDKNRSS